MMHLRSPSVNTDNITKNVNWTVSTSSETVGKTRSKWAQWLFLRDELYIRERAPSVMWGVFFNSCCSHWGKGADFPRWLCCCFLPWKSFSDFLFVLSTEFFRDEGEHWEVTEKKNVLRSPESNSMKEKQQKTLLPSSCSPEKLYIYIYRIIEVERTSNII